MTGLVDSYVKFDSKKVLLLTFFDPSTSSYLNFHFCVYEVPRSLGSSFMFIGPFQRAIVGLRSSELVQIRVNICVNSVLVHF